MTHKVSIYYGTYFKWSSWNTWWSWQLAHLSENLSFSEYLTENYSDYIIEAVMTQITRDITFKSEEHYTWFL